jgi:Family of unknown function (DUF6510)
MTMDALDGNAIAGQLVEIFGTEMTTAVGTCAKCGATRCVAEFVVYERAPGTVGRCRSCGSILMVLVTIRHVACIDLTGLSDLVASDQS